MKKEFIIDGKNFSTAKGFFDEIKEKLAIDITEKFSNNLDLFDDILEGGYGQSNYQEEIIIRWINIKRSRRVLKQKFIDEMLDIFKSHDHILLIEEE